MTTAKIFENGRSQAVRLPKECRLGWDGFLQGINMFSDDFMEDGRSLQEMQERESL